MRIREAEEADKATWDSFVDAHQGSFYDYFDFRNINKNTIQLVIENDQSQLVCLCWFQREQRALYSFIRMSDLLFSRDETEAERYRVTYDVLKYVEKHYSKRCSTFVITEQVEMSSLINTPIKNVFIDFGFRLRSSAEPNLPCLHILPLKAPFEECIWKGLWSKKFRWELNKVEKMGVKVIQDRELNYMGNYLDMLVPTFRRFRLGSPDTHRITTQCNLFKDKTKLFIALLNDQPLVIIRCHYTSSTCYLAEVASYTKDVHDANKYCYKAAIEDACNHGYKFFSFGNSRTESLAQSKEKYKAIRKPIMAYEKRYSMPRVLMELTPIFVNSCLKDKTSLWKKRRLIWDRIFRW